MNQRELRALKKLIDERNEAAADDSWEAKPWPNTLPRSILNDITQLVELHEFEWRASLDLQDMAVIIAQRTYDRAKS